MMAGLACFAFGMWNFTPITHDWGWRELLLPQAYVNWVPARQRTEAGDRLSASRHDNSLARL
jgi:hypothetical protein